MIWTQYMIKTYKQLIGLILIMVYQFRLNQLTLKYMIERKLLRKHKLSRLKSQ